MGGYSLARMEKMKNKDQRFCLEKYGGKFMLVKKSKKMIRLNCSRKYSCYICKKELPGSKKISHKAYKINSSKWELSCSKRANGPRFLPVPLKS